MTSSFGRGLFMTYPNFQGEQIDDGACDFKI